MRCDQCEMATINGVPCHEHGCPNSRSRWDAESESWVAQRRCGDCGETVDHDDPCCSEPDEVPEDEDDRDEQQAVYVAERDLRLALTRYERLCSPPRWMLVPIVPSIDAAERARDHCIDIGRDAKAAEIESWLDAEWRRRELLAQWSGEPASMVRGMVPREMAENWKGRTLYAWSELHSRLCQARDNAVSAGILDRRGQAYVAVSDRIRDVEHRCRVAWRRQTRGEPAVA